MTSTGMHTSCLTEPLPITKCEQSAEFSIGTCRTGQPGIGATLPVSFWQQGSRGGRTKEAWQIKRGGGGGGGVNDLFMQIA